MTTGDIHVLFETYFDGCWEEMMNPYNICLVKLNYIQSHCVHSGATYGGRMQWSCGYWLFEPVPAAFDASSEAHNVALRRSTANPGFGTEGAILDSRAVDVPDPTVDLSLAPQFMQEADAQKGITCDAHGRKISYEHALDCAARYCQRIENKPIKKVA